MAKAQKAVELDEDPAAVKAAHVAGFLPHLPPIPKSMWPLPEPEPPPGYSDCRRRMDSGIQMTTAASEPTATARFRTSNILAEETTFFEERLHYLAANHDGKWVAISGRKILDTFDTEREAIETTRRQLGNIPVLIRRVDSSTLPVPIDGFDDLVDMEDSDAAL